MFKKLVWATTSFIGFHCWPEAPTEVDYLRNRHRHVFNVKVAVRVYESNREVEFHLLKAEVDMLILKIRSSDAETINWSCEHWAEALICGIAGAQEVTVDEDGENGATLKRQER